MFEQTFYHSTIRNIVVGFGTLFSNVQIRRDAVGDVPAQVINVPIAFGPKEKWHVRVDQDPDLNNHVFSTLPRLAFEISGYTHDPTRMVNRNNRLNARDGNISSKQVHAPVPYNIEITMYALTKGTEDGLTIVEQILPLFAPEYTLNLNTLPEIDVKQDVPIILNSVSVQDDYEGDLATRRLVTHTFNFTAKALLYGPVTNSKIIKHVTTNMISGFTNSPITQYDVDTTINTAGTWTPSTNE